MRLFPKIEDVFYLESVAAHSRGIYVRAYDWIQILSLAFELTHHLEQVILRHKQVPIVEIVEYLVDQQD